MTDAAKEMLDQPMTPIERVRCALAMAEAGYDSRPDNEDVAKLLAAYDDRTSASAPSQAIVAGGVRAALEHARVRFECLAEEFDKAGDSASWAMCSVDAERMSRALALSAPIGGVRRWRHKKRGSVYTEVGRGLLQTQDAGGLTDNEPMVVYRNEETGALWIRDVTEFEDGRFEALPAGGTGG
jgi:hypothetical protein